MHDHPDTDGDALALHRELGGILRLQPKLKLTEHALELVGPPAVSAVSRAILAAPGAARDLTWKANAVAVVGSGTAEGVSPETAALAQLPRLEGEALALAALAGIDAIPLPLMAEGPDALVTAIRALAPGFGAVSLLDPPAPACLAVARRLAEELDVPVLHSDLHGLSVTVLAGLHNAARVTGRSLASARVVVVGAGAGAHGVARLLDAHGVGELARLEAGPQVGNALRGADVVVALSGPGALTAGDVAAMAGDPIVFALGDPEPELDPDAAARAGARVVATRRADYVNRIDGMLAQPGLLRGALDAPIREFTDPMLCRAAAMLAACLDIPDESEILPHPLDPAIAPAVAAAVIDAAASR